MLLLNHTTIGAVIGKFAPDPITAFALGLLSHFIADLIPHGDAHQYEDYKRGRYVKHAVLWVVLDVLASIGVAIFFFESRDFLSNAAVAAGIAGAVVPDLIVGIHELKPNRGTQWFRDFHFWNHNLIALRVRDWAFLSGTTWQLAFFYFLQNRI